jgi:hypothetical protein
LGIQKKKEVRYKSKELHTTADRIEQLISSDGRIKNLWFLPHFKETLTLMHGEALITQLKVLNSSLKIFILLHDVSINI